MNRHDQLCRGRVCAALILSLAGTIWMSSASGEEEKAPATISQWKSQILAWKKDLRTEPIKAEELAPHEAAAGKLASITDPLAVSVLGELLEAEDYTLIKVRLIPSLANIPGNPAAKVLVKVCVEERSPILVLAAAKAISESEGRERAIPYFVKYLERPQYRDRLAYILPKTGLTDFTDDTLPSRELFEALVTNLVTKDISWMPGAGWGRKINGRTLIEPGKLRDASTIPGERLHRKSDPLIKKAVEDATPVIEEEGIRQVLVSWTGEDFGFDQGAWRKWHADRMKDFAKTPAAEKNRRRENRRSRSGPGKLPSGRANCGWRRPRRNGLPTRRRRRAWRGCAMPRRFPRWKKRWRRKSMPAFRCNSSLPSRPSAGRKRRESW